MREERMNCNPFLTYNKWFVSQGLRESFKGEYVSLWWEQHLVPLLERGLVPPKRFWLHQHHRYQDIYHRMVHDYPDQFNSMIDSLDHKARMNYHRSMLMRATRTGE